MIKIPEKIEYVIKRLAENGYEAYVVGGCVRDSLLGKMPSDFDVTTSCKPEDIIGIFDKTVPTGIKHGTVTVIIEGEPIEVTTFRTESGYSDSRHPDKTEFVTDIKFDLSRRDFTVNAMAYNNESGLIDLFGGKEDLKNGILRAVGNPENRFSEDALRILRLFRFASKLGFWVEKETLCSALSLQEGLIKISKERIFAELYKAVSGENPEALKPLIENGGLSFLNINKTPDFEIIKGCRENPDLAFFAFLSMSSEDIGGVLNTLKTSNALKNYCNKLEKLLLLPSPQTKAEIKEMLNIASPEIFEDYITLKSACKEETGSISKDLRDIIENAEPYSIKDLSIGGTKLLELGIESEKIGGVLEELRKYVVKNSQKNNEKDLTEYLKNGIIC